MKNTHLNHRSQLQYAPSIAHRSNRSIVSVAMSLIVAVLALTEAATLNAQPPASSSAQMTGSGNRSTDTPPSQTTIEEQQVAVPAFDSKQAFEHLQKICATGPRISTTNGMLQQQKYLGQWFKPLQAEVSLQKFFVRNPLANQGGFDGRHAELELSNMIVRFRPERKQRLLFCCHYDTRPYPDRDRRNPQGTFIGANDGASGVAVLCELGRNLAEINGPYGIDLVFFDGEEFVYVARRDPMFLGSNHFAKQYIQRRDDFRYAYAVLIDMVGDKNLQIYFERNSLTYAPRLTRSIWGVAKRLKVREFIAKAGHEISDDHLPLNRIAGIPTCDIIDFDFPTPRSKNAFWHTEQDIPENCSAESLGKVGKVLLQWTIEMQKLNVAPANR
ncbi:M28 family peptidase [bacterium]|nr:M28 family peptidase [bacterium]